MVYWEIAAHIRDKELISLMKRTLKVNGKKPVTH
jgi:hypothetical protein